MPHGVKVQVLSRAPRIGEISEISASERRFQIFCQLWCLFTKQHEPILAPNPRNEVFGGSPPTRPAKLLRRRFPRRSSILSFRHSMAHQHSCYSMDDSGGRRVVEGLWVSHILLLDSTSTDLRILQGFGVLRPRPRCRTTP